MREEFAARLDRMAQSFEETRGRILAANDAVAALRVTRRSEDELIEVTVGADRALVDLRIADEALDRGSGRLLAQEILALAAEARTEVARTTRAEYQRLTGVDPAAFDPTARGPVTRGHGEADRADGSDPAGTLMRLSRELFGG